MNIKFLDLKKNYDTISDEINNNIQAVLNKCNYIHGKEVTDFENNFAKYIGINHCIGVANGTDALEIAIQSLDLEPDAEIIVQGNTYIASCLGVVNNRHKLVICDCDKDTHLLDINDFKNKITSKTRVIVVVHLFGLVPDMDEILKICNEKNIILIEDCAQSHGAKWNNKTTGSFGKISCFSFYPGKNLGAYGDGGAICTDDNILNEKIRKLANLGCKIKYYHELIGKNSRLDTIQATILNTKLKYLEENNDKRRKNAELYRKYLSSLDKIQLPIIDDKCTPVYHLYVIKTMYRDELKKYLLENGIECNIHYPISITEVDAFKSLKLEKANNAIQNSKEILSLPMYPELTEDQIQYISTKIKDFFNSKQIIIFNSVETNEKPGILHYINSINFDTKRIFYIDSFKSLGGRGNHSNTNFNELFMVLSGSVEIKLTSKYGNTDIITLQTGEAYLITKDKWIVYNINDTNTVICVLVDKELDQSVSEFNYDNFIDN
jgi:dTDP-4-amino-4,6-dideoxygalactose transaminase